jgi:hypothetical protein
MDSKPKKPAVHHTPLTHAEKEKKTNRWVTIGFAITAVIIVLVIGYGILNETVFKNNAAVATIGNEKITGKEFIERVLLRRKLYVENYRSVYNTAQYFASDQNMYSYFTSQLQSYQAALADPKLFGQSVLDLMVEERIIAMEAAKKGIKVSEHLVFSPMEHQPQPRPL